MANFYTETAWACLRSQGFKKKALNFYKSSDQVVVVINFQKSDFSDAYYLNFGIWIKLIEPVLDETSIKSNKCHIVIRMERLLPEFSDTIRCLGFRSRLRDDEVKELDQNFHKIFGVSFQEKLAACLTVKGLNELFCEGAFSASLVRKEARDYFSSLFA